MERTERLGDPWPDRRLRRSHPASRAGCVFLLSLLVRALFLFPVLKSNTPPKFDEHVYYVRAVALDSIVEDLAHFRSPDKKDRDVFYNKGIQPPFQSIWLSLGMLLFGKTVAVARLMSILLSAMTTVLVFLLSARMAGTRTGFLGSLLHIFYPSFLAFSHFLWSETTYIFLLLLAVYLATLLSDISLSPKRTGIAILLGVTLGCLALTRAAALVMIFIVPVWVFLRSKTTRAKVLGTVMILAPLFLTLFPWEQALYHRENRFVLISNYAYRNLFFGLNPWREHETDNLDDDPEGNPSRQLRAYASSRSIPAEQAAKELAIKEIVSHPGAAILRGINEFLYLWTYDFFTFRHIVNAAYPPVPNAVVLLSWGAFVVTALAFYLLVLKGLLVRGERPANKDLLVALVLGGALPYAGTFGNSRFNLPQMALLLPLAAVGLANFGKKSRAYLLISAVAIPCLGGLFYASYPDHFYRQLRPSSRYEKAIGLLDRFHKTESLFGDVFTVQDFGRKPADALTVTIANNDGSDYSFDSQTAVSQKTFSFIPRKKGITFAVFSRHPKGPLEISIRSKDPNEEVRVKPVAPEFWNSFSATGLQDLKICWHGGR